VFNSKIRPVVITQYEHGRLAGILAQHWGNENFDRPAVNFASFVQGVALHDWHFGFYDNLPIIGADEADWLAVTRHGIELRFDDPVTDIVAKLHLRRLLSFQQTAERQAMMTQIDEYVSSRLPETGHSRAEFDWADKITRFCDYAAFHFSFEAPVERPLMISRQVDDAQETTIIYEIKDGGEIMVDPWPFALPFISGSIIGFQAESYPDVLQPLVLTFHVVSNT